MDKIWVRNPSKSEKTERPHRTDKCRKLNKNTNYLDSSTLINVYKFIIEY